MIKIYTFNISLAKAFLLSTRLRNLPGHSSQTQLRAILGAEIL
jgi:hypothetical protein